MTRKEYYKIIEDEGIIVADSINKELYSAYEPIKAIEVKVIDKVDDLFRSLGYKLQERMQFQEDYNLRNYVRAILSL